MPSVRFLSVDARRVGRRVAPVAALIAAHAPDLVCVRGAPSGPRWRTVSGALARQAGLVVVSGGRPAGGTLLLSSLALDVVSIRDVPLPGPRPRWPAGGATLAVLSRGGSALAAAGARLAGAPDTRHAQAVALQRALTEPGIAESPEVLSVTGAPPAAVAVLAQSRTPLPGGVYVADRITATGARCVGGEPGSTALLAELSWSD